MMNASQGVAVVTGAAMGIGRAIAEAILRKGGKVVIADVDEESGKETTQEMVKRFGPKRVLFIKCDVRKAEDFEAAFDLAQSKFGTANILVNNAGIGYDVSDDGGNLISINITAVVRGTRLALKRMSRANGGQGGIVVNISSLTALHAFWISVPLYAGSKAFVALFSKCLGTPLYYDSTGVRIVCISPGVTETPLKTRPPILDTQFPGIAEEFRQGIDQCLPQKPENVGEAVVLVVEKGENGANYLVENDKPPLKVHLKMIEGEYLSQ